MQLIDNSIDFDSYANRAPMGADIKSALTYHDAVVDEFYGEKATHGALFPWRYLDWFRFRSHEVTVWSGYNGHGKSLMLGQVMLSIMNQGFKACIASMEMTPSSTLARMARQATRCYMPTKDQLQTFNDWTDGRLWLFDQVGSVSWQRMVGVIRYSVEEIGIDHFVVDSLMKCGIAPDDYNTESAFLEELTAIAKGTGVHIHLVHHGRKPQNENTRMSKYDIRGTGQTTDKADNVMLVSRNKKKERERMYDDPDPEVMRQPDAWLTIDKQRHGTGEEGDFRLFYHKEATLFQTKDHSEPIYLISDLENEIGKEEIGGDRSSDARQEGEIQGDDASGEQVSMRGFPFG